MGQRILNVRVRPFRVAVLIGKTASQDDLLLALKFLSRLWGGRYCQLLPVESDDDPLARFRLSESRPDFVYGIGIDHAAWGTHVRDACQARIYRPLESRYVEELHDSGEGHITVGHVIQQLLSTPGCPGPAQRPLRVVGCDPKSPLLPFVAALLGIHYENLGNVIPCESSCLVEAAGVADFIAMHSGIVANAARCWLDLTSHGLTPVLRACGWGWSMGLPPTIVLVDSLIPDLTLFWNLRLASDSDIPTWVIPIPSTYASDPVVLTRLKEWLLAFEVYQQRPNFCRVVSASVPIAEMATFADRLKVELKGTHIQHVDPQEPPSRLPLAIASESSRQLTVELSRRTLAFQAPIPVLLEGTSRGAWMVELLQDVQSSRAVNELCLPPRTSAFEVLNAPGPTSASFTAIPPLGDGIEGFNVRCSGRKELINIPLPSGDEILDEALREGGITPRLDEKRACYLPVMRMFGGLEHTAQAFTGQRGTVLRALLGNPMQVCEIQKRARLGNGNLAELEPPNLPKQALDRLGPVARRIYTRRRRERGERTGPATTQVESLLEFWADKGIVSRQWRLGPCPACLGSFWEPRLDIARPVVCPGCGNRLRLRPQVPLGYSLHRLIGHAMKEGIAPVMLAGRFLKNLTTRGFLWMPGVKCRRKERDGDLDLIACCDGHIVVGECKTMEDTPVETGFWEKILGQFEATIELGRGCRASVVLLAVLAEAFPPDFQDKVDKLTGPSMRCLLLDRQDLTKGYRTITEIKPPLNRPMSIHDLVVDPMPEPTSCRSPEPREIRTPYFLMAY